MLHAKYRNSHCRQSSTSTSITHWLRQEISLTCPKTRGQKAQLFCPVNYKPYSWKTGGVHQKPLFTCWRRKRSPRIAASRRETTRSALIVTRLLTSRSISLWSHPTITSACQKSEAVCVSDFSRQECVSSLLSRGRLNTTTAVGPLTPGRGGDSQLVWGGQRQPIPKMIPKWWGAPICSRWLPPGRHLVSPMIIIQFYGGGVRTTLCKQSLWIYHWSRQTLHCVTRATQVGW